MTERLEVERIYRVTTNTFILFIFFAKCLESSVQQKGKESFMETNSLQMKIVLHPKNLVVTLIKTKMAEMCWVLRQHLRRFKV